MAAKRTFRVYRVEQIDRCTVCRELVCEVDDYERAVTVAEALVAPFVSGVVLQVEQRRWTPRVVSSR